MTIGVLTLEQHFKDIFYFGLEFSYLIPRQCIAKDYSLISSLRKGYYRNFLYWENGL